MAVKTNAIMPFVDLSLGEREKFFKRMGSVRIPGYTGHCPTMKFRIGKRYGANANEIFQEIKNLPPVPVGKAYKQGDPVLNMLKDTVREKGQEPDPEIFVRLPRRPFILGYTGYIPGLNFEYGKSFSNAANQSIVKFTRRRADEEREKELFISTAPQMCTVRSKDEVKRLFNERTRSFFQTYVPPVTAELPPIAGYTGYIPRVKGSEASLSKNYNATAKIGLGLLKEERNQRQYLETAKEAVADAISHCHTR